MELLNKKFRVINSLFLVLSCTLLAQDRRNETVDPLIIALGEGYDSLYVFQGYMVYQLVDGTVSPSELGDVDRARLVAQCDIKDGVDQLVNFTFNENFGANEAEEMVEEEIAVELPKTAAGALPVDQEEPLTVTITAEGSIQIQTTETQRDQIITRLRGIAAERESDRVFLRADGAVPYLQVMQVMGALNAGGFSNIGLVTDIGGPALDGADQ